MRCRRPVFDQVAGNRYVPGEGLAAHVDLPRFLDGICILALGSSAILELSQEGPSDTHQVRFACSLIAVGLQLGIGLLTTRTEPSETRDAEPAAACRYRWQQETS